MTKMAAMPIYGKNLKKSSSPQPIAEWPWNLVCSIVYASTTKVLQIMTPGWPWLILRQGQIWSHTLLYGKKLKIIYFLESIAALGLRVAWSIQLNEVMKFHEYQSQGHSLTLVKGHSDFKVKTCFSQKQLCDLEPKFMRKLKGCCCVPILLTTFPPNLSGTHP